MSDFAQPAEKPGRCPKCKGTGLYKWGGTVNGKPLHSGACFSCQGTGWQDQEQIGRNRAYNRFKLAEISG